MSGRFEGERVLVVGAGVAGRAAADLLVAEGAQVRLTDERPAEALGDVGPHEVSAGGHREADLDGMTLVVVSPGVPPSAEVLTWAASRGLPVWGEMELGARVATTPYLAVTGTNGKTTTTGMLAACLRASGTDVVACGNIGYPFPAAAASTHEVLVVEVSSFQLALQESFHPRVSVLLNLAPDHLDWHGSFDAYAAAKARVYRSQGADDVHVGNRDDEAAARISAAAPCPVRWFRLGVPGDGEVGYVGDELVARWGTEVRLGRVDPGHGGYRSDAAAAACAALAFGAEPEAIARGLAAFEPAPHRGEVVAVLEGVRFIDNSKATNVHAALAAIEGVTEAVLIAGGRAKGQDLRPLAAAARRLRAVVAIGESADEVRAVFRGLVATSHAATIEEAVRQAYALAESDGVVLLAPACASWDQFSGYEERGDRFTAAARALADEVSADAGA